MNKLLTSLILLLTLPIFIDAQESRPLAFPTAEGYGRYATGGRGGRTYVVTSLEDCAENNLVAGTFRWAVKQPGKKIVTFAVCGTIYLNSALCLDSGDLTILGQTAPGDGICLADYPVTISCENAIIRYLRFRLGQRQVEHHEGDGFGLEGCNNVIIDHCSVSWSIDECLSVSGATNSTIQWCIVSQALNDAGHTKGAHGYGGNWGGTNVTFSHNLIAQCTSRVPRLGGDTYPETQDFCDLRNNVFYNWGGLGCYGAEAIDVNFVGNYYKPGPSTDTRSEDIQKRICAVSIRTKDYFNIESFMHDLDKWGHFYTEGNYNPEHEDMNKDNWTVGIINQVSGDLDGTWTATTRDTIRLREPREFVHATTHSAEEAYSLVLDYAGASLYRDCVDEMIVSQVLERWGRQRSGTNGATWGQVDKQSDNVWNGQLLASQVENGAWPILEKRSMGFTDSDGDGIDDNAEDQWNLDSSDPSDGATLYSGRNTNYQGYSYVEIFNDQANKKRREWNAHCTEGGEVKGVDEPTIVCLRRLPWEHEISQLTFKGYNPATRRQLYADGLTMEASGGISGGTGRDMTLKLRAQQYTINIPTTIKAKAVRIYGYSNSTGSDISITELNGKKYSKGTYTISAAEGARTDITIPLDETVSGKPLTITFADNLPTVRIYIVEDSNQTGISTKAYGMNAIGQCFDLLGRLVTSPSHGIYIINGKRTIVK